MTGCEPRPAGTRFVTRAKPCSSRATATRSASRMSTLRRRSRGRGKTQSPTKFAGLRRLATSLWLHFVASPQRVPALITGVGVDMAPISSISYLPFVGRPRCGDNVQLQDRLPNPSYRPERRQAGCGPTNCARVPVRRRHQHRLPIPLQLPLPHRHRFHAASRVRAATSMSVARFALTDPVSKCRAPLLRVGAMK